MFHSHQKHLLLSAAFYIQLARQKVPASPCVLLGLDLTLVTEEFVSNGVVPLNVCGGVAQGFLHQEKRRGLFVISFCELIVAMLL